MLKRTPAKKPKKAAGVARGHEFKRGDVERRKRRAHDDDPLLPILEVAGGNLSELATKGEKTLLDAGEPFYQRGAILVRPIIDKVDAARGRTTKVAMLKILDATYLRDRLNTVVTWVRYDARTRQMQPINCPAEVSATILARHGHWSFPSLGGIVTVPTMRPDGSLLTKAGYDPATRLLLVEPPELPPIPDKPTRKDAQAALALLKDLLTEFPFVDAVARAVALSALITPIARGAYAVTPMHVARAPVAASGKSYLWDIVATIAIGHPMPVIAAGRTEEETEKRLGSALIAGRPLISIDNVNGDLGGDALCQIIERPFVEVRILGKSELVRIEAKSTTTFATGNNITVTGDLCRRVVIATLDAEVERPELRTFNADPVGKVLADRGSYIAACLTICRAYLVAGRPNKSKRLASFGDWSDCVRSALIWLGEADCVASMEIAREEDLELTKLRDLLTVWHGLYGETPIDAATLIKDASCDRDGVPEIPEFHAVIDAVAGYRGPANVHKLGNYLRKKKGRVVEGLRLTLDKANKKGGSFWQVAPVKKRTPRKGDTGV